jgi:hypothetical protein
MSNEASRRWGRSPIWQPDADSQALMGRYAEARRSSARPPRKRSLANELGHLRSLVSMAKEGGGPTTLAELVQSPDFVVKLFREWPKKTDTGFAYLRSFLRLMRLVVEDESARTALEETVLGGLWPTPLDRRNWTKVPRTVGGTKIVDARRPILWASDLNSIVEAAGKPARDEQARVRQRAAVALLCYSGLKPGQLPLLKRGQIVWLPENEPWCAVARDVERHGRLLSVPIALAASDHLRALWDSEAGAGPDDYLLGSSRSGRPMSYTWLRRVVSKAVERAGLPLCDDVALKRAYVASLKLSGVPDYVSRDALGFRYVASVDSNFTRHAWAIGQRKMAEHHMIPRGHPAKGSAVVPRQQELHLDGGKAVE